MQRTVKTIVGWIRIEEDENMIVRLEFVDAAVEDADQCGDDTPLLLEAFRQLDEYFCGSRKKFDLPLKLRGTEFQKRVWHELLKIPYGETASYKDVAIRIGNPGAARAVGMANHNNPIAIIVPCHRVITAGGRFGGYAGGLDLKNKLLVLENKFKSIEKLI